ncbi:MAG: Fe-S cluster assembly protein SufD [Anaerolineaceae bacterium]|nr:Fe-S cluster assembly protein SufD [Anaerolineaceae bacterium]
MTNQTSKIITRKIIGSLSSSIKEIGFGENDLPLHDNDAINQYRKEAWHTFSLLPFPSKQDEAWRRTSLNLLDLGKLKYSRIQPEFKYADKMTSEDEGKAKEYSGEIRITDKNVTTIISEELRSKGVLFFDLRTALSKYPKIVSAIRGTIVPPKDGKFAALASAFSEDGLLLYVPKNLIIDMPFHAIISNVSLFSVAFSHIIVWLEDGAEASLFLEYSGDRKTESGQAFHSGIVEVLVGSNSKLKLFELQSMSNNVWSIMHERAKVSDDGELDWVYGAFGSHMTKNFSDIDLVGQGAQAKLSGLYICNDNQHMDLDTQQNHLAPDTTSDLLYKGVIKGKSRSVWQGMIFVAPNAMKTDGYQKNKNLLLSKDAQANSIPGLEILANDVRCSHGSTVSNIDSNELFYLETRGINQTEAEGLIVKGFLNEIIERIPSNVVRDRFDSEVNKKLRI